MLTWHFDSSLQGSYFRMVGNPYLGITSGLLVIRPKPNNLFTSPHRESGGKLQYSGDFRGVISRDWSRSPYIVIPFS
jgi:hypothetical protein